MSAVLKMFAVEFDGGVSRAFNLTDHPLGDHLYQGIMLFDSKAKAQAEVDEENRESLEDDEEAEDEFSVTTVLLHADGRILDEFGEQLNQAIALQSGHNPRKVAEDVRAMYAHQAAEIRKTLADQLAQPGI